MSTTLKHTEETNEQYHADASHVSASMLKVLHKSPQEYYERFVARTLMQETTPAMAFGSAFHMAILEPELFATTYTITPKFDRRTNAGKAGWNDWQAANEGKLTIDQDSYSTLLTMQSSAMRNPELAQMLKAGGDIEKSIRWHDRIDRKAKPDKVMPQFGVVLDLKTIADASPHSFASTAAKLGWWIQSAWYLSAVMQAHPQVEQWRIIFAAIGKSPPHEVGLYQFTFEDCEWAEQECEKLVSELIRRQDNNDWLAGWQKEVTECPLPSWVKSNFYNVESFIESEV